MLRLLPTLALWLAACGDPEPPPTPPDLTPVVARISATLDEAVRLDRDHRDAEALEAWRRAHALFEAEVEGWLSTVHDDRDTAATEYTFGRVRSEIEQYRGSPAKPVRALKARLELQVEPLGQAPPAT